MIFSDPTRAKALIHKSHLEDKMELLLLAEGLTGYEEEHRFCPDRGWRFDFAYVPERVAVEVEGGIWVQGRHLRGKGFIEDCVKYGMAALMGWKVFRVTEELIDDGTAIHWLREALGRAGT